MYYRTISLLLLVAMLLGGCANRIEKLSPEDRELYDDIAYIATPAEKEEFFNLPSEERAEWVEKFWQRRDPTPGTPRNERREEHLRRVQYTIDNFSLKSANIPGWKTDIGRIYIKYGPPDEILNKDVGLRQDWIYYDLGLKYRFDEFGSIIYPFPGDQEYEVFIRRQNAAPLDRFLHGGGKLPLDVDWARFYTPENQVQLELYYEYSAKALYFAETDSGTWATVEHRFSILDINENEIESRVFEQQFTPDDVSADNSLRHRETFTLDPGEYHVVMSLTDKNNERMAHFRSLFYLPEPPDSLQISDLAFAHTVELLSTDSLYAPESYRMEPNPTRRFRQGGVLYCYYDIYHIPLNTDGTATIELEYRVRGQNLMGDVMQFKETRTIDRQNARIIGVLDLENAPYDTYNLVVIARDQKSGISVSTTKTFQIVGWSLY